METPKSPSEALAMGWRKVSPEKLAKIQQELKAMAGSVKPQLGYPCYDGPCEDGWRTVCYYRDDPPGCTDCFESQQGC